MSDSIVQVQVSSSRRSELQTIVDELVERRLIACGKVGGPVTSRYWWEGRVETAQEWLGVLMTTGTRVDKVIEVIRARHSDEVPEVVAYSAAGGLPAYFEWVRETVSHGD